MPLKRWDDDLIDLEVNGRIDPTQSPSLTLFRYNTNFPLY
jgi:hypothetical protein